MSREEERNTTAHKIAWEYTKHYDPLLSKESWCELAARDAIDWADQHPRKGLWDSEKVIEWIKNNFSCSGHGFPLHYNHVSYQPKDIVKDLQKAMEESL